MSRSRGNLERSYRNQLLKLAKKIAEAYQQANDLTELRRLARNLYLSPEIEELSKEISTRMVTGILRFDSRSWREAARKSNRGKVVFEYLRKEMKGTRGLFVNQLVNRNAIDISKIPLSVAEEITDIVAIQSQQGRRAKEIFNELRERFPSLLESKAKMIARTEVSRTHTSIVESRSLDLDLNWYRWMATKGGRTRDSHRNMEGVLINWRDPPSPEELIGEKSYGAYHAGGIFNCRCEPIPLIDLDEVSWPHKVYKNGGIITLTRREFEKIM